MFAYFDDTILHCIIEVINDYDIFVLSLTCKKAYSLLKKKSTHKYRDYMFMNMTRLMWAWNLPYFYIDDTEHQYMLCELAISMDNLEALRWLREVKNCLWETNIVAFAMYYGNYKIIQYILYQGASLSLKAVTVAKNNGNLDILYDILSNYRERIHQ